MLGNLQKYLNYLATSTRTLDTLRKIFLNLLQRRIVDTLQVVTFQEAHT